jgi:hypothetical protein
MGTFRKWLLVLAVAIFAMGFGASAFADKRIALIIGNSAYSRVARLSNPENDAQDTAATLRGLNFEVIYRANVDQRGLSTALEEFERKAVGADTALFFFAGHGLQHKGQNYLLPIDADLEDEVSLKYNTLPLERVRDALSSASGVKILILDACRNNPLSDRLVRTAGLTRSASATRGLARLDRAEGMVVAYATQADDVAQDGSGRNSPFSSALNRRLIEPNLEIATLFRRVAQDVYEQTGGKQRPELSISLLQDFYLNLREDDSQAWRRLGSDPTESDMRNFITKFPSSPFVRDAQNRLYILESARNDEKKRQEIVRLQSELQQLRQREDERIASEKTNRERQNKERDETERLAALQREKERLDAERRAAEQKDAEKREQARLEQQKQEAEHLAAVREAEARNAAEKLEQQRLAAEKAEQQRLVAEKTKAEAEDRKRQEAARLQSDRLEKEKLAADERDRKRLEMERLAAEQLEKTRIEKEQREAALAEQKRLAERKVEAERQEKERQRIAALEGDNRRKAVEDAEKQRMAQVCAEEKASVTQLSGDKKLDELKALRAHVKCAEVTAEIDVALNQILKNQELACREENRAYRKIAETDFNGLKLFNASATCAPMKKDLSEKIANLETQNARTEAACAAEDKEFQNLHVRLQNKEAVFVDLKALQGRLSCERLRTPVAEAVKLAAPKVNTPELVKSAQVELKRIGCYSGETDGEFSRKIKASLKNYWTAKGAQSHDIVVDEAVVGALKGDPVAVCHEDAPAVVEQPKPKRPAVVHREEEPDHTPAPNRRRSAPSAERPAPAKQAARPARAPAPAAAVHHPTAIMGTGF